MTHERRNPPRPSPAVLRDYLRLLGDDVDGALALIVHDLVATGALHRGDAEAAVRIRATHHLDFQRAAGFDVYADETALWVAEAVQEELIEGLGSAPALVTWPPCPDHPNHPLWLRRGNEKRRPGDDLANDPVWTCLATNRPVAELGRL